MRATLKQMLEMLGVGVTLSSYETWPWSHYDSGKSLTCSAEVRMGPDGDELEAEVQLLYDTPPPGKSALEQVMYMTCKPFSADKWSPNQIRIKSIGDVKAIYDWETKACNFFSAVVSQLEMGQLPDIETLIDDHFHRKERFGDKRGGGGKSPRIKPAQLTQTKKAGF